MIGNIFKSLAVSSLLLVSAGAFAQSGNSGNTGSSGNSGNSGTSGSAGFNIDFFAGSVPGGANSEQPGGLTNAIERAFGGAEIQDVEAGKRK